MRKIYGWLPVSTSLLAAAACATAVKTSTYSEGQGDTSAGATEVTSGGSASVGGGGLGSNIMMATGTMAAGSCVSTRACTSACTDFSTTPILDGTATQFTASTSTTGGPCLVEPGDGALLPNNWVRPRFRWTGGTAPFELTIHSGREANDLVVYTSNSEWTLPATTWAALAQSAWDDGTGTDDITVTVADAAGGSTMKFDIAPAAANGSMIYWTAAGDTNGWSWLEGFGVGNETVATVLTAPTGPYANAATQVQWTWSRDSGGNLSTQNRDTNVNLPITGGDQCIGCHVAVPDQNSVAFVDFYPWDGVTSAVNKGSGGAIPTWLTPGGAETLSQGWLGMLSFSTTAWTNGDYRVVAGSQVPQNATSNPWAGGGSTNPSNLIWINLATTAAPTFVGATGTPLPSISVPGGPFFANQGTTYGFIERTGDPNSASCPSWSHDSENIVYASNTAPQDGRLAIGKSDLYVVPYNAGAGGAATALQGAATTAMNEFYPAYSPDDTYVAYTAAPSDGTTMYYNPKDEVYVIPAKGGTATRLKANDPPACLNAPSPGVTNSWPRWSPEHPLCSSKTYYWIIFSSTRLKIPFKITTNPKNFKTGVADGPTSQLYLTAIVDDGTGNLTTYPGVYIWNQSTMTADGYPQSNHTPAWEVVNIPPPPQPPK
ncbi:MAG: hypothetical protein ABSC94_21930 [Polyangiaceae bacterium]|jgi:hypothetical protein